jgi:hypothetical protein
MRKTIPKEVHIYCDRCGARCNLDTNYKRAATVKVERGEPDHMWEYHSHTRTFDICDKCSDEVLYCLNGGK